MKTITIQRLDLQFDADQITHGSEEQQASQAVEQINRALQNQLPGLCAQLFIDFDEIEVEINTNNP